MVACGEYLQHSSSVVDEDGLFISGPAVVKILYDSRPRIRYFQSSRIMPDICLASSKIGAQKLHYYISISATKGQHLQGSAAVKIESLFVVADLITGQIFPRSAKRTGHPVKIVADYG